ncbi:MAG: hypothetical protein KJZ78_13820 [Bryobacteraceae bacterium]|nr:hypothetical protein [Bryobacteraceae bacterium]
MEFEPVIIVVSREEIESRDTSAVLGTLKSCIASTETVQAYFEKVDVAFHGYNEDSRELFEIPEVREYVGLLDDAFPYWLFFLTKSGLGLQCIMLCFMPPYLTEAARRTVLPQKLDELLSKRWLPAMNEACISAGFSEQQIEDLTNNVVDYFIDGPRT